MRTKCEVVVLLPRESREVVHDHEVDPALVGAAVLEKTLKLAAVSRLRALAFFVEALEDLAAPQARDSGSERSEEPCIHDWSNSCQHVRGRHTRTTLRNVVALGGPGRCHCSSADRVATASSGSDRRPEPISPGRRSSDCWHPERRRVSGWDRGVLQRHAHSRAGLSDGRALHGAGIFRSASSLHPGVCQPEPERARPLDLASSCRTDHPPLDPSLSAPIGVRSHDSGRLPRA